MRLYAELHYMLFGTIRDNIKYFVLFPQKISYLCFKKHMLFYKYECKMIRILGEHNMKIPIFFCKY